MFTAELDQTIAAVASAPGGAGRGIVRVSGGDAVALVHQLFEPGETDAEPASTISYRAAGTVTVSDFPQVPADAWVWPTARSYTGQPMVELHLPGSPPLLERVLETLFEHGVRPARAGEFTLRAFLAGRMDLAQAEAVLGVIDADDHEELTAALNQLAGGLSGKLLQLRGDLLELLAEHGITTFEKLASESSDAVRRILDASGSRFRPFDPTTWPLQASLAAEGRWLALKAFEAAKSEHSL